MDHVPLSQRWVQLGMTFAPLPQALWGRSDEIEAIARHRGLNAYSPPALIDSEIAAICRELLAQRIAEA